MAKKEPEVEQDPPEANEDADRALDERISRIVNAAISTHSTRLKGTLSKEFDGLLGPIKEALAKATTPPPPRDASNELDIERQKSMDRIRELEDKYKAAESAREAEAQRALRVEERNVLQDALRKGGVDDARIRPAVALLYTEEQRIVRDDNGKVSMKVVGKYGEELLPVDKAVAGWLQSDDGKIFLPPRGAAGSGSSHSGRGKSADSPKDKAAQEKADAIRVLQSAFGLGSPD